MKRVPYFLLAVFLISACDLFGNNSSKDKSKQEVSYEFEVANREFSTEEWEVEDSVRISYVTGYDENSNSEYYPERNTEVVSGPNFSETESINLSLGNPDGELPLPIEMTARLVREGSHRIRLGVTTPALSNVSTFDMGQTDLAVVAVSSKESD